MDGMNTNFLFGIKRMGAVCSYCSPNTRLPTCARGWKYKKRKKEIYGVWKYEQYEQVNKHFKNK